MNTINAKKEKIKQKKNNKKRKADKMFNNILLLNDLQVNNKTNTANARKVLENKNKKNVFFNFEKKKK
jgi:hypothetical protein